MRVTEPGSPPRESRRLRLTRYESGKKQTLGLSAGPRSCSVCRFSEPAMHKALFFALLAAFAVNVACLCSHL